MATHYVDHPSSDEALSEDYLHLMGRVVQADGKKWIYARAGAGLTAKTPYGLIHEGGAGAELTCDPVVKGLLTTAVYQLVCVPSRTLQDNDTDWFQIQGTVEDLIVPSATYTATHALGLTTGAVVDTAGVPTNGDLEFGSVQVGGTTVAAIDAFLFGRETLSAT